jgi:predicted TIM-barrel fold metal-dependent hydrolase
MSDHRHNMTRRDFLSPRWQSRLRLNQFTLEYLKRMVGAEHAMVGTDYPYDLGDWWAAEKIQKMECTSAEREAMLHGNARKLLRL